MCIRRRDRGFTLTELMFVVAIAAIVAMVALPTYDSIVTRSKRTEGKAALVDLANRMEKHFYGANTYAGASVTTLLGSATTESGYYLLQISTASATAYTLQAQPTANFTDSECQTLTLDQAGTKGVAGSATKPASECW